MSHTMEPVARNVFAPEVNFNGTRHMPILSSSSTTTAFPQSDAMDITPPASASHTHQHNSSPEIGPETQRPRVTNKSVANGTDNTTASNGATLGAAASSVSASAAQPPKVVQTAFIHKLYSMLEDQSIKHLISWSDSAESFTMSPSPEFSKVLAQYFKHTNISSFVRQLNMYGFHKVSDVFHTGQPDSALWEFKHGNGSFKRGDVAGLREIKRRASRHNLIQRPESFATPHKPSISQPGTPAEPIPELPPDVRLANVEGSLHELHARLMRTEESNTALSTKCALLNDSLSKYHHWTMELAHVITKLIPDQENPIHAQVSTIHKDMLRHADVLQRLDDGHDALMSGRPYFSNLTLDAGALSPRQRVQDDRRGSFQTLPSRTGFFRTPAPPHLPISPRRFGSIGAQGQSPSFRSPAPIQPPIQTVQHPLASVEPSPNLARRHTSADIRDTTGWPPQPGASPFEGPATSTTSHWPSSPPSQTPTQPDPSIQSVLASYSLGGPRQPTSAAQSRHGSPPAPDATGPTSENGFAFRTPNFGNRAFDSSGPPTRRGSIAHLLNVNDGVEVQEDDGNEDRKRKRL